MRPRDAVLSRTGHNVASHKFAAGLNRSNCTGYHVQSRGLAVSEHVLMSNLPRDPKGRVWAEVDDDDAQDDEPVVEPLTREQAQALIARHPQVSVRRMLSLQAAAGVLCAVVAWGITRQPVAAGSALAGAASVVIPAWVMARGLARQAASHPSAAVLGFMVWELVKMVCAVAILVAAAVGIPHLNWLAMLITMVVCLKVNWWMLLKQRSLVMKR
jgi:ATP synthase protein I